MSGTTSRIYYPTSMHIQNHDARHNLHLCILPDGLPLKTHCVRHKTNNKRQKHEEERTRSQTKPNENINMQKVIHAYPIPWERATIDPKPEYIWSPRVMMLCNH